ncbi:MAG: cytochrome c1 [Nereida ignava]|uniref:cytochrome c1 n=1 Tax=Nereida ignava TaxID=282199 RepID=UPI0030FBBB29
MLKKLALTTAVALGLSAGGALAAGGSDAKIENYAFSFEGLTGSFDQNQLQRGLQVYTEICAACHGLKYVSFRNLSDDGGPALPEDQVFAYAEEYEVFDAAIDDFRSATPADKFPASALANAPDLSLMAKARAGFHGPAGTGISQLINGMGGPEYIASLLAGYTGEEKEEAGTILYENTAFPGGWISMAPPLYGDDVEFADEDASTELEDIAQDVSAFLMWTAEPKMMARKQAGLTGLIFLSVLSVLLYLTNKRLWAAAKGKKST